MDRDLRVFLFDQLLDSQGAGKCIYCEKRVNRFLKLSHPRRATLDHIIPRSRGGASELENFAIACRPCNDRKGALSADRFRQVRKRLRS